MNLSRNLSSTFCKKLLTERWIATMTSGEPNYQHINTAIIYNNWQGASQNTQSTPAKALYSTKQSNDSNGSSTDYCPSGRSG